MANGWTDFSKAAIWRRRFTDVYSTHAASDDVVAKVSVGDLDVFRASSAYVRLKDGTIRSLGTDAVRSGFEYNNATGLYERAIRLEPQRTNGFTTYSTDLSQSGWNPSGLASTTMVATGPDGVANSACRMIQDTSTGTHSVWRALTWTAGVAQAQGVWLRAFGAQRYIQISWQQGSPYTDQIRAKIDLVTGAVSTNVTGAGVVTCVRAVAGPNGWWRVLLAVVIGSASTGAWYLSLRDPTNSTTTFTGDGVSGVDVYNVQPELNCTYPSSDMPVGATGVTRAGDRASLDLTGTALATPGPLTCYVRFIEQGHILDSALTPRLVQIGDSSPAAGNNSFLIFASGHYAASWRGPSGVNSTATMTGTAPVPGDLVELCASVDVNGLATLTQSVNGGTPVTVSNNAGTGAAAFESAYSSATLNLMDSGGSVMALKNLLVSSGTYDLGTMRELANE